MDWESKHNDDCHYEISVGEDLENIPQTVIDDILVDMENCPICQEWPKEEVVKPPKTYTSHAECAHPRTPKDREICRRARRAEK